MSEPFNLDASVARDPEWHHAPSGDSLFLRKGQSKPVARVLPPGRTSVLYMWWFEGQRGQVGGLTDTLNEACRAAERAYERTL